ncbi:epimerase family protein SDR39U1-like [Amphiura filiformis]|uniref:epimerase family protein SDR39U1-like n=1 Tax=Amphiura filiformis TaxID=82378 RepID=UPI003B226CB1
MQVIIGGGSGFLGTAIRRTLQQNGHKVTIISRTSGADRITWNQLEKTGLPECDAVVGLSGENILNPLKRWNEQFQNEVRDSRLKTTASLVKAITQSTNPPKVFVNTSAIGIYPSSATEVYTEDFPAKDIDYMTKLCIDWEEAARLPSNHKTRQVIVRTGLVLGKDGGAIQQMIWPFWFGVGGVIGSGTQYFPWIHVDDLSGIFTHAIENDDVTGVLNGVSPKIVTNHGFTKAFGRALCRPTIFPLPGFVVNAMFGPDRGVMLLEGQNVKPKRTLESGYKYRYDDIDEALKEIVSSK